MNTEPLPLAEAPFWLVVILAIATALLPLILMAGAAWIATKFESDSTRS